MDDYEIAIRKWAITKIQDVIHASGRYPSLLEQYGFTEKTTWRDLDVEEYHTEGYQSDDSFAEPADNGFRVTAKSKGGRRNAYEISTVGSLGRTIFEISRIEITDEDRKA